MPKFFCIIMILFYSFCAYGKRDPFQDLVKLPKVPHPLSRTSLLDFELLQINYAKASELAILLTDKHAPLLSKRGHLSVDTRTNTLWIQDTKARRAAIKQLIHQLDVPVKQVLIEARIVDVNKEFSRDLGISWGLSPPEIKEGNQPFFAAKPLAQSLNIDLAAMPALGKAATLGLALATLGEGIFLDLELSAMENEGRGEVIARPRLITLDQKPAVIESGEDIPYQEGTSSGATVLSFKKAVLSLKVTPHISPNGKIMMNLQITQDTPSLKKVNGVPSIYTKEIQTTVFINDGQTIVLGGIYKQEKNTSVNRVPFLGNFPILGALFRNKSTMRRNEELLIFITPRIIAPESGILALPIKNSKNINKQ